MAGGGLKGVQRGVWFSGLGVKHKKILKLLLKTPDNIKDKGGFLSMNISSLISSANFKPLNLIQKAEKKSEGEPLPCPEGKQDTSKGTEDFAVILERTKNRK